MSERTPERESALRISVPQWVCLVLYYGIARHLPSSSGPGGAFWSRIRRTLCSPVLADCGKGVNIERNASFGSGARVCLGDRSGLGLNARLVGEVSLGQNVMMGPDVLIMAVSHAIDRVDVPMIDQGVAAPRPVTVEDDVWIGARAVILPGVRVGRGAVIGAGAVVTKSVPQWAVVAGVPARLVRFRTDGRPHTARGLPSPDRD